MNKNNPYQNDKVYEDEITLIELFALFWDKKKFIISITLISAILAILYSLSLPNLYTSRALLIPSEPQDGLSSKIGGLSSLGGIAGISFPETNISKSKEAIQRIKSHEFFYNFLLPNIELENLMAVKKWNEAENTIIYDDEIYNSNTKEWVRDMTYSKTKIPSSQEAYEEFRKILLINQDNKTSFVNISIEHQSPIIAKKWTEMIIKEVNQSMRAEDQSQAKKSISYLSEAQQSTNIQSIKEVTSLLLEDQMQTLMLTSSNENYVFKIIDSPLVSEKKSAPNRSIIVIITTLLGFTLSIIFVFIQHLINKFGFLRER